jgi:DNA polymerase-1
MIKIAMIRIHDRIDREGLKSHMILQVHDELVFECPDSEIEAMKRLIKEEMEGVVPLVVPIKVEIASGKNWDEAH